MGELSSKDRLLNAAIKLFAENGVKGTPVRALCKEADVGLNMVVHYFGSKEGLVNDLLLNVSPDMYRTPLRIINEPAKDKADFTVRLRLFCEETLQTLIENKDLLEIIYNWKEIIHLPAYAEAMKGVSDYQTSFIKFLESGKKIRVVRADADLPMISGLLWDRFATQILHHKPITQIFKGADITEKKFRKKWLEGNLDILCLGLLH